MRLRARVFSHIQQLPPDFFGRHRLGDLVERLTGDIEAIEQMVVSGVIGIVSAVFSVLPSSRRGKRRRVRPPQAASTSRWRSPSARRPR
jgi:hypothetical protein